MVNVHPYAVARGHRDRVALVDRHAGVHHMVSALVSEAEESTGVVDVVAENNCSPASSQVSVEGQAFADTAVARHNVEDTAAAMVALAWTVSRLEELVARRDPVD